MFKIGDVVALKSHQAYKMTVTYIDGEYIECSWYHIPEGKFHEHKFHQDALIKLD